MTGPAVGGNELGPGEERGKRQGKKLLRLHHRRPKLWHKQNVYRLEESQASKQLLLHSGGWLGSWMWSLASSAASSKYWSYSAKAHAFLQRNPKATFSPRCRTSDIVPSNATVITPSLAY